MQKGSDPEISWLASEDPLYTFLPWLNACWLRVEVGSLLDLEFCLGWTRVYLWIDTIEITFEGKSLDLS